MRWVSRLFCTKPDYCIKSKFHLQHKDHSSPNLYPIQDHLSHHLQHKTAPALANEKKNKKPIKNLPFPFRSVTAKAQLIETPEMPLWAEITTGNSPLGE